MKCQVLTITVSLLGLAEKYYYPKLRDKDSINYLEGSLHTYSPEGCLAYFNGNI